VSTAARIAGLALAGVLLGWLPVRAVRHRDRIAGFAAVTVFPYLVVASASRPAQR